MQRFNKEKGEPIIVVNEAKITNMSHVIALSTSKGIIQFETYDADAPKTVRNFIDLVNKGFYDGIIFHRVIKNFMIQGGDPYCSRAETISLCGTGGLGYQFEDELNPVTDSYKNGYQRGVVAMANAGKNTNGSQFFIMLNDTPLPHDYTIFGRVVLGQEIVDLIGNVKTNTNDRPTERIVINKATVEKKSL